MKATFCGVNWGQIPPIFFSLNSEFHLILFKVWRTEWRIYRPISCPLPSEPFNYFLVLAWILFICFFYHTGEMCCHFLWLLGNVLAHFILCWLTLPSRGWRGTPPVPYLCLHHRHVRLVLSSLIRKRPSQIRSFHVKAAWETRKEDKEEVIQGVHVKFKGKCTKIKIVNERTAKRDSEIMAAVSLVI